MGYVSLARKLFFTVSMLLGLVGVLLPDADAQTQNAVHVLRIDGVINPPAAGYIERGIRDAVAANATAVVIEIDTPGGLDDSTREIVQSIDNALIPVIVYVTPQGGRAASAGTFIAMAAHVAAMAPGTTIGSATPVSIGTGGDAQDLPEDLRNKVVNEAVSYIRAHAEERGRNAEWAEKAVREGANLPANEALDQNVVDVIALDLNELLTAIDGRQVKLGSGETVALNTGSVPVVRTDMSLVESFLHTISNPNLAFIFLSLGTVGIFFEIANPGMFFPGVTGGILLLVGLYSLGTLNAFWGGVLLVLLALGLFIAEALTATNGILAAGGIIAMIVGGMLLFFDAPPGIALSPWTLAGVTAILAMLTLFYMKAIVDTRKKNIAASDYQGMVGAIGVTRTDLSPEGFVFVRGERWRARSTGAPIPASTKVVIEGVDGLDMTVRPVEHPGDAPGSSIQGRLQP